VCAVLAQDPTREGTVILHRSGQRHADDVVPASKLVRVVFDVVRLIGQEVAEPSTSPIAAARCATSSCRRPRR